MKSLITSTGIALLLSGLAAADTTGDEVLWSGHSSSDWQVTQNWIDPVTFNPIVPTTNDIATFTDLFTASDFQPSISGTNLSVDVVQVESPYTDVTITVSNGTFNLDRNSQTTESIQMKNATKALTITGPGTFVQKGQYGNTTWFVTENDTPSSQGGLFIDTDGFLIEDTKLTIDVALRRQVRINSSAAASPARVFKTGQGRFILGGHNEWTGTTTIDDGRFIMATDNPLSPSSTLIFNDTAIFEPDGFDAAFSILKINDAVTFNFKNETTSQITFANSSGVAWGAGFSLAINNFTEGVNSIRFGTDSTGLTPAQLAGITINGLSDVMIDANGYIHTEFREFIEPDLNSIGALTFEPAVPADFMELSWNGTTNGQIYQVEYTENLATGDWQNYTNVIGTGTNGITITVPTDLSGAFFHVISEGFEGF